MDTANNTSGWTDEYMAAMSAMILWMQSLSDATRTRLLRMLERTELTVVELCTVLQLPQSTVSRHLKLLSDESWIGSRRDGTSNLYRMRTSELESGQRRLWQLVREQSLSESLIDQDEARLEQVLSDRRSRSQTFFSTAVGQWDRLRSDLFGRKLDAWALAAMLDPQAIVGDLGCGTGGLAQLIAPWVRSVIAVDSSAAMLQAARKRIRDNAKIDLRRGELIELPIDNNELTLALMVLVLPYAEAPEKVLGEVARVTRPKGRLVLLDMQAHERTEYREELGHTWLGFEHAQVENWLLATGFGAIQYTPLPPDPDAKGPGLFIATAEKL